MNGLYNLFGTFGVILNIWMYSRGIHFRYCAKKQSSCSLSHTVIVYPYPLFFCKVTWKKRNYLNESLVKSSTDHQLKYWYNINSDKASPTSSEFMLSDTYFLWYIQQRKLCLSSFEQHGVPFPFVVAESNILPIDVPVASLQLSDQRAFGYLSASQQTVRTDIVGERGKQERILPELPEHRAELP